jgi:hypothetical protein
MLLSSVGSETSHQVLAWNGRCHVHLRLRRRLSLSEQAPTRPSLIQGHIVEDEPVLHLLDRVAKERPRTLQPRLLEQPRTFAPCAVAWPDEAASAHAGERQHKSEEDAGELRLLLLAPHDPSMQIVPRVENRSAHPARYDPRLVQPRAAVGGGIVGCGAHARTRESDMSREVKEGASVGRASWVWEPCW